MLIIMSHCSNGKTRRHCETQSGGPGAGHQDPRATCRTREISYGFHDNHVGTAPEKVAGGGAEISGVFDARAFNSYAGDVCFHADAGGRGATGYAARCAGYTCHSHAEGSRDAGK